MDNTPLSKMTTPFNPPPQLSEATFRTYEPFIHRAITAWPEETRFTREEMINSSSGRPLSPNTFAARMRDSVTSLRRFGWETYIDLAKFASIFGQFSVAFDTDGSVWFRNRGRKGRPLVFAGEAAKPSTVPEPVEAAHLSWSEWEPDDVRALCRLLHTRKFPGTVILTGALLPNFVTELELAYNVGIFVDTATNRTVIS